MKNLLLILVCISFSAFSFAQTCGNLQFGTATSSGNTFTVPVILLGNSTTPFLTFGVTVNSSSSAVTFEDMSNSIHPGLHSDFNVGTPNSTSVTLSYTQIQNPTTLPFGTMNLFNIIMTIPPGETVTLSFGGSGGNNGIFWENQTPSTCTFGHNNTSINTGPSVTISGNVDLIDSVFELEDVDMEVQNASAVSEGTDVTDGNGDFAFPPLSVGVNYTVIPTKTDEVGCGLSSFDSHLIQEHILDRTFLIDKRAKLAADVNLSGTITNLDVILINQQLNGSNTLPNAWYFIPDGDYGSIPFDNTDSISNSYNTTESYNNSTSNSNFYAIKTGDTSEDCNPTVTFRDREPISASRSGNTALLTIADVSTKANESVEIPIYMPDFINKSMLSLSLEIDGDALEDIQLKEGDLGEWNEDIYHIIREDGKTIVNLI